MLAILRIILWFKNWQKNRKLNVSGGLIQHEEKPSVDELDRTPVAIYKAVSITVS